MSRESGPFTPGVRFGSLDILRGVAVLWMTAYHFAFDLNHFGFIQQDFYRSPVWTLQRTCILSLFLLCAGMGQALATAGGQSWQRFWRRWVQIAGCALLVSIGSVLMFPNSWIYFGVLHGMAAMLLVARLTVSWGRWLWPAGLALVVLDPLAPLAHAAWPWLGALDRPVLHWLGFMSHKPATEDYVPLLPWMGVMWWGVAAGQFALARGWFDRPQPLRALAAPAWVGRWSLSWYMLHQPVLMGLLMLVSVLLR